MSTSPSNRPAPRRHRPVAGRGGPAAAGGSAGRRCWRCAASAPPPAARAQRRAEATETRSALLSAVGHDLRSPLTSIKAAADSLRDPSLPLPDGDRQELPTTVEESADRLTALVDNLLDSSRLAAGAVTPLLDPHRLRRGGGAGAGRAAGARPGRHRDRRGAPRRARRPRAAGAGHRQPRRQRAAPRRRRPGRAAGQHYADRVELRVVDAGPGVPRRARTRCSPRSSAAAPPGEHRRRAGPVGGARIRRGHGRHPDRGGHPGGRADHRHRRCDRRWVGRRVRRRRAAAGPRRAPA